MPKLYFGSRGGMYYRKKGRKVYVKKHSSFGMDYANPGGLGGLGQGYVAPDLMYSGFGEWRGPQEEATAYAFGQDNHPQKITKKLMKEFGLPIESDEKPKQFWNNFGVHFEGEMSQEQIMSEVNNMIQNLWNHQSNNNVQEFVQNQFGIDIMHINFEDFKNAISHSDVVVEKLNAYYTFVNEIQKNNKRRRTY